MSVTKVLSEMVSFVPVSGITSTNVQAAIPESAANLASSIAAPTGSSLIGYLPAGTGAVATTVQTKLRTSVSVKDFGAVGNGIADDTASIQAAIASLNGNPGTILFPSGTYKVTATCPCFAGQNFISEGAKLDVTSLNAPLFAYNNSGTLVFNFANPNPPSLISGFNVLGKAVNFVAGNTNFYLAYINRTPYVTIRDCKLTYAGCAHVTGESILCNFENIHCYNPVSDSFTFDLGAGEFGPNACTFISCEVEEQKYYCNGISIYAGTANLWGCQFESLTKCIYLNGSSTAVYVSNCNFGIRTMPDPTAIWVDSAYEVSVFNSQFTFGGRYPNTFAVNQIGLNINSVLTQLTFIGNNVSYTHDSTDSCIMFAIKGIDNGNISANFFDRSGSGTTTYMFDFGNSASYYYSGLFNNNNVLCEAGGAFAFTKTAATLGYFGGAISNNIFIRVTNFLNLAGALVSNNQFIGSASTIAYTAGNGFPLKNNVFSSTGWTITNGTSRDGNTGLTGSLAPQIQSNSASVISLSAGTFANVVVPVPYPFSDANYVAVATCSDTTYGATTIVVDHICQISASQVTVTVKNNSAGTLSSTINVLFSHA